MVPGAGPATTEHAGDLRPEPGVPRLGLPAAHGAAGERIALHAERAGRRIRDRQRAGSLCAERLPAIGLERTTIRHRVGEPRRASVQPDAQAARALLGLLRARHHGDDGDERGQRLPHLRAGQHGRGAQQRHLRPGLEPARLLLLPRRLGPPALDEPPDQLLPDALPVRRVGQPGAAGPGHRKALLPPRDGLRRARRPEGNQRHLW